MLLLLLLVVLDAGIRPTRRCILGFDDPLPAAWRRRRCPATCHTSSPSHMRMRCCGTIPAPLQAQINGEATHKAQGAGHRVTDGFIVFSRRFPIGYISKFKCLNFKRKMQAHLNSFLIVDILCVSLYALSLHSRLLPICRTIDVALCTVYCSVSPGLHHAHCGDLLRLCLPCCVHVRSPRRAWYSSEPH